MGGVMSRDTESCGQSAPGATTAAPAPLSRWVLVPLFTAAIYFGITVGTLLKP
jgi:hypothetical protein